MIYLKRLTRESKNEETWVIFLNKWLVYHRNVHRTGNMADITSKTFLQTKWLINVLMILMFTKMCSIFSSLKTMSIILLIILLFNRSILTYDGVMNIYITEWLLSESKQSNKINRFPQNESFVSPRDKPHPRRWRTATVTTDAWEGRCYGRG